MGTNEFSLEATRKWLDEETQSVSARFVTRVALVLVQCASPRCLHFIRNVPPEHFVASGHHRNIRVRVQHAAWRQQPIGLRGLTLRVKSVGICGT